MFYIPKKMHSYHNKCKPLPSKFCKGLWHKREEKNVLSFVFDSYFDFQCVNVASNNSFT